MAAELSTSPILQSLPTLNGVCCLFIMPNAGRVLMELKKGCVLLYVNAGLFVLKLLLRFLLFTLQ